MASVPPPATSSLYAYDFDADGQLVPALLHWRDDEHLSYTEMVFRLHDDFKIDTGRGTVTAWFRIIDERILPKQAAR